MSSKSKDKKSDRDTELENEEQENLGNEDAQDKQASDNVNEIAKKSSYKNAENVLNDGSDSSNTNTNDNLKKEAKKDEPQPELTSETKNSVIMSNPGTLIVPSADANEAVLVQMLPGESITQYVLRLASSFNVNIDEAVNMAYNTNGQYSISSITLDNQYEFASRAAAGLMILEGSSLPNIRFGEYDSTASFVISAETDRLLWLENLSSTLGKFTNLVDPLFYMVSQAHSFALQGLVIPTGMTLEGIESATYPNPTFGTYTISDLLTSKEISIVEQGVKRFVMNMTYGAKDKQRNRRAFTVLFDQTTYTISQINTRFANLMLVDPFVNLPLISQLVSKGIKIPQNTYDRYYFKDFKIWRNIGVLALATGNTNFISSLVKLCINKFNIHFNFALTPSNTLVNDVLANERLSSSRYTIFSTLLTNLKNIGSNIPYETLLKYVHANLTSDVSQIIPMIPKGASNILFSYSWMVFAYVCYGPLVSLEYQIEGWSSCLAAIYGYRSVTPYATVADVIADYNNKYNLPATLTNFMNGRAFSNIVVTMGNKVPQFNMMGAGANTAFKFPFNTTGSATLTGVLRFVGGIFDDIETASRRRGRLRNTQLTQRLHSISSVYGAIISYGTDVDQMMFKLNDIYKMVSERLYSVNTGAVVNNGFTNYIEFEVSAFLPSLVYTLPVDVVTEYNYIEDFYSYNELNFCISEARVLYQQIATLVAGRTLNVSSTLLIKWLAREMTGRSQFLSYIIDFYGKGLPIEDTFTRNFFANLRVDTDIKDWLDDNLNFVKQNLLRFGINDYFYAANFKPVLNYPFINYQLRDPFGYTFTIDQAYLSAQGGTDSYNALLYQLERSAINLQFDIPITYLESFGPQMDINLPNYNDVGTPSKRGEAFPSLTILRSYEDVSDSTFNRTRSRPDKKLLIDKRLNRLVHTISILRTSGHTIQVLLKPYTMMRDKWQLHELYTSYNVSDVDIKFGTRVDRTRS